MSDEKTDFNFEASLETLGQLVEKMESGSLSLEESLSYFEQGVKLTKQCQQALNQANKRVETLIEEQGNDLILPSDNIDDNAPF